MNGSTLLLADKFGNHFSQYADLPLVEKEINSLQKQNLNTAPSFANNDGNDSNQAKEAQEKHSGARNSSDKNQAEQRHVRVHRTSASETEINKEKNKQDQLNRNNSNQEECREPGGDGLGYHPLKAELGKAVKPGAKEHVSNKIQAAPKGEDDKNDSAESNESDKRKTEKDKKNSSGKKGNKIQATESSPEKGSKDSKVDADLPTSDGPHGTPKPGQDTGKMTYAEAASNSEKQPSRRRAMVIYLI